MGISAWHEKSGLLFEASSVDLERVPHVDCHLHTSWTDGKGTVCEMYNSACDKGIDVVLFSEHSRKTSTDWFGDFVTDVRNLPNSPCKAYVGTEVKVESRDGQIDTKREISDACDFIMASVHRLVDCRDNTIHFSSTDPDAAVEIEYAMTMAVLDNPAVNILGHMFGMSYRRFGQEPSPKKIKSIIQKAAEKRIVFEINSHYHRNYRQLLDWCREYDAVISFGSTHTRRPMLEK